MKIENQLPFNINWEELQSEKLNGTSGYTSAKTKIFGTIKIRQVEYSKNYDADHWCVKGHIIHVLKGELIIEYDNKTEHLVSEGMTYIVGDDGVPHKAKTTAGATVLVID